MQTDWTFLHNSRRVNSFISRIDIFEEVVSKCQPQQREKAKVRGTRVSMHLDAWCGSSFLARAGP